MHILHTPARFYPYVGGVEKYVETLGRELVKKKHDVSVICANEPSGNRNDHYQGIRVKRLLPIGKIANTNITPGLPYTILSDEFDIIHTHIPTPWSADWSAIAAGITKTPLVLTYHNDIAGEGIYNSIATVYNRTLLRFVLKKAGCIIVTSPNFRTPWLTPFREKIALIPNCVDTMAFKPAPGPKIGDIFFLGVLDHYHRYKGLDYLLAAVSRIVSDIPEVKLIIGGTGAIKEYYTHLSHSLGISENVEFAGYIPDDQLIKYYNGCSMFVLPSIDPAREGFGIVLLEAMACGRPVISTSITGVCDDIEDQRAGIIVPPKNAAALGEAIKTILLDKKLANEMGSAGRLLIDKKYSSVRVAQTIIAMYEQVISQS
ncbi:MAG TPA: glycosyltransferase family 4 protein [Methanoregulaceae archaeon]|nr:glycosyltransferase family 4 protein [Methanoregulaceae archaeon]